MVVRRSTYIYVDGKPVPVRRIISVTATHIVVEHLDGTVEAIEIGRVTSVRHGPVKAGVLV